MSESGDFIEGEDEGDQQEIDESRQFEILGRVLEMSRRGELNWRPRETRPSAYHCDVEAGNFEVGTVDNDGDSPFDFRVFSPGPNYELLFKIESIARDFRADDVTALWHSVSARTGIRRRQTIAILAELRNASSPNASG
jgi:hypothetical protein